MPMPMDEPIGVLHVVDCLNVGGTERQMFELVRRLDRRRWRPLIATFKPGGELLPQLRALDIEPMVFPLNGSLTQPNTALQVMRMAWHLRKHNVRVLHAHDFYSNVIGVAAATVARVRSIASRRDLAHWLNPTQRKALTFSLKLSHCVVANASAVGELVSRTESVPASKLRVVPNGIDVTHFDTLAARAPEPPLPAALPGVPRIAMIASMHLPDKGHADLLEAAALLEQRGVRAQYLFVSDGTLRPALERRAHALGLDGVVCFLGRRNDVPAVLTQVDLLVHPSWAEGFPNAVLEGMCAGKPVIATRVGGIPEVLIDGEFGHLVDPRQPAQLAQAIADTLADPTAMRALGRRGRQHVERTYSLERLSATMDAIYSALASNGAPRLPAPGGGSR